MLQFSCFKRDVNMWVRNLIPLRRVVRRRFAKQAAVLRNSRYVFFSQTSLSATRSWLDDNAIWGHVLNIFIIKLLNNYFFSKKINKLNNKMFTQFRVMGKCVIFLCSFDIHIFFSLTSSLVVRSVKEFVCSHNFIYL